MGETEEAEEARKRAEAERHEAGRAWYASQGIKGMEFVPETGAARRRKRAEQALEIPATNASWKEKVEFHRKRGIPLRHLNVKWATLLTVALETIPPGERVNTRVRGLSMIATTEHNGRYLGTRISPRNKTGYFEYEIYEYVGQPSRTVWDSANDLRTRIPQDDARFYIYIGDGNWLGKTSYLDVSDLVFPGSSETLRDWMRQKQSWTYRMSKAPGRHAQHTIAGGVRPWNPMHVMADRPASTLYKGFSWSRDKQLKDLRAMRPPVLLQGKALSSGREVPNKTAVDGYWVMPSKAGDHPRDPDLRPRRVDRVRTPLPTRSSAQE